MSAGQMPLPLGCKITVFQLSGAPPVILAQTLFPQRAALAVPFVRLIEPIQPAGTAVQCIQPQLFPSGADIGVLSGIVEKRLSFQLHIGTVMGRLMPDKESDAMLLQHPVGQGEVIGRVCGRGLDGNYVLMDMF